MEPARRLLRSATGWSAVSAALRLSSAVLVLPLMTRGLSSDLLGLWYVFMSLATLGSGLDIAMQSVAVRSLTYLNQGVPRLLPFGIAAPDSSDGVPVSKAQFEVSVLRYYRLAAGLLFVLLLSAGTAWLAARFPLLTAQPRLWIGWAVFGTATALQLWSLGYQALLNGHGNLWQVQRLQAAAAAANQLCIVAGFLSGAGLPSLLAGYAVLSLVQLLGARRLYRPYRPPAGTRVALRETWAAWRLLWPQIWRSGGNHVAVYLILNSGVLICGSILGLRAAASLGVTQQLMTGIMMVSAVWMTPLWPRLSSLRAAGDLPGIDAAFRARLRLCLGTYAAGALAVWGLGDGLLARIGSHTPLLAPALLALLAFTLLLQLNYSQFELLVLTGNRNPFTVPYLISGTAIAAGSILLAPRLGIAGAVLSQFLVLGAYCYWKPVALGIAGLGKSPGRFWRDFFLGNGISP